MDCGFIVSLIPELERLAYAFRNALHDNAIERDDLVQEGVLKLLEVSDRIKAPGEGRKRQAIRVFINECRTLERKSIRRYAKNFTEIGEDEWDQLPAPYSFTTLLTRMAIEECLDTLGELDKSLVMEFIQPSETVAAAAVARIRSSAGHGTSSSIALRDIAVGRKVSRSAVSRALHRARVALVVGGFRN